MGKAKDIKIQWVAPDGPQCDDSVLYGTFARLLCPDAYASSRRSREAVAAADRIINALPIDGELAEAVRIKAELEAKLDLVNARISSYRSLDQDAHAVPASDSASTSPARVGRRSENSRTDSRRNGKRRKTSLVQN